MATNRDIRNNSAAVVKRGRSDKAARAKNNNKVAATRGKKPGKVATLPTSASALPLSGHVFGDGNLKELALTHSSNGKKNNEKLEFLGDAVLQFVVSSELYRRFAHSYDEGKLTLLRTDMVKNDTLAQIASGEGLKLKTGGSMNGQEPSSNMLADAVEAMVGAIYLDVGMDKCHELVVAMYSQHKLWPKKPPSKTAKNQLQELLQQRGQELPKYESIDDSGQGGKPVFTARCHSALGCAKASGISKVKAELAAAQKVLDEMRQEDQ